MTSIEVGITIKMYQYLVDGKGEFKVRLENKKSLREYRDQGNEQILVLSLYCLCPHFGFYEEDPPPNLNKNFKQSQEIRKFSNKGNLMFRKHKHQL